MTASLPEGASRSALVVVLPLVLATSVLMLGHSLLGLAITLNLTAASLSANAIGLVLSAFFLGFLVSTLVIRRIIGRIGHIRAFAALGVLATSSAILHGLVFDVLLWAGLRALFGFCYAGLIAVIESWLNTCTANATRARVITFYMTCYYLALAFGQLLVNVWSFDSASVFMISAVLVGISLLPVLLTNLPQPEMRAVRPISMPALYRVSPLALVGTMTSALLLSAVQSLAAVYGQDVGMTVLQISLFTGAMLLGPVLLLWPVGRLSDRVGRRRALSIVLSLVSLFGLGMFVLQWLGRPIGMLLPFMLLLGGSISSIYPNTIALAYDRLPREQYVAASGALLLAFSLGGIGGPMLGSWAMEATGPDGLFLGAAIVAGLLLFFTIYRSLVRPAMKPAPNAALTLLEGSQLSSQADDGASARHF